MVLPVSGAGGGEVLGQAAGGPGRASYGDGSLLHGVPYHGRADNVERVLSQDFNPPPPPSVLPPPAPQPLPLRPQKFLGWFWGILSLGPFFLLRKSSQGAQPTPPKH